MAETYNQEAPAAAGVDITLPLSADALQAADATMAAEKPTPVVVFGGGNPSLTGCF